LTNAATQSVFLRVPWLLSRSATSSVDGRPWANRVCSASGARAAGLIQRPPRSDRQFDGAHASAEPARYGPEKQSERTEQGVVRDGSSVGYLRRLLLGLRDSFAVLLFILLNLGPCLLDRDILYFRDAMNV